MANGYEQTPGHEALKDQSFNDIVKYAASNLTDFEAIPDPYQKQFGIKQLWNGRRHHENGRIEFGDDHEVGRLRAGDFMLIFAHDTRLHKEEFIVHEFAPGGGLASRCTFEDIEGRCHKSWALGELTYMEEMTGRDCFSRDLGPEESDAVRHIMAGAITGEDVRPYLEELVQVSDAEQRLMDKNTREAEAANRRFKEEMRRVDEAEKRATRRAWAGGHRLP